MHPHVGTSDFFLYTDSRLERTPGYIEQTFLHRNHSQQLRLRLRRSTATNFKGFEFIYPLQAEPSVIAASRVPPGMETI